VGDSIVPTTRQIQFHLDHVVPDGTYTLRVALAAAHMSRLQVLLAADQSHKLAINILYQNVHRFIFNLLIGGVLDCRSR
jgi:hypothetical protein